MDYLEGNRTPPLWPPVEEDPLTGFPNLIALLADLKCATKNGWETALGLCLTSVPKAEATRLCKSILRAIAEAGLANVKYYRLTENEFCVYFLDGAPELAKTFVACLEADDSCPAFTYAMAEPVAKPAEPIDALLDLWTRMQPRSLRESVQKSDWIHVARHLVAKISETADLLRDARRLAYTDDTTGLPNYRAASFRINAYLSAEYMDRHPVSLLFVDGDNLRQYNDELGYQAGNEMIRRLGATVSSATNPGELVSRWLSGDEFMIILPATDKQKAILRAGSICAAVKKESAGWPFPITVSIGVVTCPEDGMEVDRLLAEVEKANNSAKRMGKNQVFAAGSGSIR